MKKHVRIAIIVLGAITFSSALHAKSFDPTEYVNTLQGTNSNRTISRGNTYPATALPFAQHTWSAQTGVNGDGWKYQWARDSIRGFQQAHQCSAWTRDYNVFSLMPVVGELKVDQTYLEPYS